MKFITSGLKTDGYGAQLLARISTYIFCLERQIPYYHTPIKSIHFESITEEQLERFFPFPTIQYPTGISPQLLPESHGCLKDGLLLERLLTRDNTSFNVSTCHWLINQKPDKYYSLENIEHLRKLYYTNAKENSQLFDLFRAQGKTIVSIHIRRNDVQSTNYVNRYIPNFFYIDFIKSILSTDENHVFLIHTDSKNHTEFNKLVAIDPHRCHIVSGDFLHTFADLVESDILLISISSFSYIPALLSKAQVYYLPNYMYNGLSAWTKMKIKLSPQRWFFKASLSLRIAVSKVRRVISKMYVAYKIKRKLIN